jgi:hypothetical protein
MKTKFSIVITAFLLTAVLGMVSTARADYFSDRQQQQAQRIRQGIASGQITPREAEALYQDQRKLHLMTRYAMADGHLSHKEGRILLVYLERTSDQIYRYKHNPHRVKPPRAGHRGPHTFACR